MQDQAPSYFWRDIKGKAGTDSTICRNICAFGDFPQREVARKSTFSLDLRSNVENRLHGWGFA